MTSPRVYGEKPAVERAAGFVLFRLRQGSLEVLLLRHRDGGHWGFPKGRIEPRETEYEAAVREAYEETGLTDLEPLAEARLTSRYRFVRDGRTVSKTVSYYIARVVSGDAVTSREHSESRWASLDEAMKTLGFAETRRILAAAADEIARREPSLV